MHIRKIISKIPFLIFNIIMMFYFYNGFVNPEKTDYWLTQNGFPILLIEFYGVIATLILLQISSKMYRKQIEKQTGQNISKEALIFSLIIVISVIFSITYFFNIQLFFYFIISISVKGLAFRNIETDKQINEKLKFVIITILSWILSVTITWLILSQMAHLLSSQMRFKLTEDYGNLFFLLWGVLYFVFLILFEIGGDVYEIKRGKPLLEIKRSKGIEWKTNWKRNS